MPSMGSMHVPGQVPIALQVRPGERRKHPRFDMHFPVFLRAFGDRWSVSETADVSAAGAFLVTDRPYLLNTPLEYVLTFPPDLTKAPKPLRVRFYASVMRCERVPGGNGTFGLAVRNTAHRYLTLEEAGPFDSLEQDLRSSTGVLDQPSEHETDA